MGLWVAAVGLTLRDAAADARLARSLLGPLADTSELDDLDIGAMLADTRTADRAIHEAEARLGSPVLLPLRILPVIGRQLASASTLASTSARTTESLVPMLTRMEDATNNARDLDRVGFLVDLEADLAAVEASVVGADLGPTNGLVTTLVDARNEVAIQYAKAEERVVSLRTAVAGFRSFLDGSTYLLLGANNAEMRLGGGMVLSAGEIQTVGGDFVLPGLTPTEALFPIPANPIVDESVDRNWGFLNPTNDMRKLGYTARFADYSGPQGLNMWEAEFGNRPDGVLLVDPYVLAALLSVIGPVEVDGFVVDESNALQYMLVDQYAEFDPTDDGRSERQDRLSAIATAVVSEFGQRSWDPIELLSALQPLVAGRHLLAYSENEVQQRAWSDLGVSGELTGLETGVFLLNLGASKLDPFIEIEVDVSVTDDGDGRLVRYDVALTNTARDPGAVAPYALGSWEDIGLEPGTYLGRLALYVPGPSSDQRFVPERKLEVFGLDGPVVVTATRVEIRSGATLRTSFVYRLPAEVGAVVIEPSARYPAEVWTWEDQTFDDSLRRRISVPTGELVVD